ncbi:MAG TPA: response regulator transcription factor [Gemmatimonadales bacterium]|jgi:DNA-binding NarL/FixJ family response regulator|nr:response regulator transcription factor [Gemmatimonadales bacterium]
MQSKGSLDPLRLPIRVLLADARLVVRAGLKHLLAPCTDMAIVGEAATRVEVLERVGATEPDVVLVDRFLDGQPFLRLIRDVTRRRPASRLLILNVESEDPDVLRILETAAAGFLSEDDSPRQITEAIRSVARGASYVSPSLARMLISGVRRGGAGAGLALLSEREYEVMCLFTSGVPFKQIAADLGVSPKTVSTYRSRILGKLNLNNNVDMIRYAIEHHLVQASSKALSRRRKSPTNHSAGL